MKNTSQIEIKIISPEESTLEGFNDQNLVILDSSGSCYLNVGEIKYVPGAMGGWYEVAVALGLIAFPISVIASCLANWISSSLSKRDGAKAKLIIRKGDLSIDIDLSNIDEDTIVDCLSEALESVDSE
jgi:hypothetical protein